MSLTYVGRRHAKISGTTSATPGTQTVHFHGAGVPLAVLIVEKSNGIVYLSAPADKDNIFVKGSAASLDFDAILLLS